MADTNSIPVLQMGGLTTLQRRMWRLTAAGVTVPELAVRLNLSPEATEREVTMLLAVLGARDLTEASVMWWGTRAGMCPELVIAARQMAAWSSPAPAV